MIGTGGAVQRERSGDRVLYSQGALLFIKYAQRLDRPWRIVERPGKRFASCLIEVEHALVEQYVDAALTRSRARTRCGSCRPTLRPGRSVPWSFGQAHGNRRVRLGTVHHRRHVMISSGSTRKILVCVLAMAIHPSKTHCCG